MEARKLEIKRIASVSLIDIRSGELIMSFEYETPNELLERVEVNASENE